MLRTDNDHKWMGCKGKLKLQGAWAGAFILSFVIAFLLVILIRILMGANDFQVEDKGTSIMLGVCFLLIVISVFAVLREFIAMMCFESHIPSTMKTSAKPSLTISLPPLYSTVVKSDTQAIQGPPAYEFDSSISRPLQPVSQV